MKTQNYAKQMTKVLFGALAAIVVLTTACSKSSNDNNPVPVPPPPVYPGGCVTAGCTPGGVGGQFLYGGTTSGGFLTQAQFQVYGNAGGNGPGSISGAVSFNNYICQVGAAPLNGPFQIQMAQQGTLTADVFEGTIGLLGPQGTIQAAVQVVPTRTQGTGLFSLYVCNTRIDMNF